MLLVLVTGVIGIAGQTTVSDADKDYIKATALEYIEGWYEVNVESIERCLPDRAKRIVKTRDQDQRQLQQISTMGLVQGVKRDRRKNTPKEKQQKVVTTLDVFENSASVKVVASDWVEYL
ncbi:hypothetical protein BH10ACI2_BH10ACI2_17370 [soil metagenome]